MALPDGLEPTFLVWQLLADGAVRILSVDAAVYDALEWLSRRRATVSEVVFAHLADRGTAPGTNAIAGALTSLSHAADEGLVTVGRGAPC
jgi:hypothetical protein